MTKRKGKPRTRQAKAPRTAAQYFARPSRQRESLVKTAHVLSLMRSDGTSLRKAAREHGISAATVRRYAGKTLRKTAGGKYKARASDRILRVLVIPTTNGIGEVCTRDSRSATTLAAYSNAVQTFLQTGDDSELQAFHGRHVVDAEGNRVPLSTDLDELERLGAAGVLSLESLYAKVG